MSFDFIQFKKALLDNDVESILSAPYNVKISEDVATSLSNVFMFLSFMFRYPSKGVYDEVFTNFNDFELFFTEYLKKVPSLPFQEELESEYVSLFITRQGGIPAAPYASLYTGDEKLLMRDSTLVLKNLMFQSGFQIGEDTKDVEDNLYIMLEFISSILGQLVASELCQKDVIAKLSAVMVVINKYIAAMLPEFSEKVIKSVNLDFYKDMVELLKQLIGDMDNLYLELIYVEELENK